jgi:hypothetical protein
MNPILLVGAVLVGLPIILHLIMKQEPKRLLFPALRFLKQKQKTNQRKLRLRHFLLLALRMLLIALFCLTLFQPQISGDFQVVNLSGEQPIAVVVVLDTSPSMGYRQGTTLVYDEARRRARELIEDLPSGSRVALLVPGDLFGNWENSPADAVKRLDSLTETAALSTPLTDLLPVAYQTFQSLEGDGPEATIPRVVAFFSDRTLASWETAKIPDLKKLREKLPGPAPTHFFFDVGPTAPVNVAILSAEVRPQLLAPSAPANITVVVQATGADVPSCEVTLTLDDSQSPLRAEQPLRADSPQTFTFSLPPQAAGFHQAVVRIRDDAMAFDNERFVVFQVAVGKKFLTLTDDPWDAAFWQLAHKEQREFQCDVLTPGEVKSFAGYEAVCLLNVADPSKPTAAGSPLWDMLKDYVTGGGKLLVAPGALTVAEQLNYNDPAAARAIMPARLSKVQDWSLEPAPMNDPQGPPKEDRRFGVSWKIDRPQDTRHAMLEVFNEWRLKGNLNIFREPRRAVRYWLLEPSEGAIPIVFYNDADDEKKRNPAVIERNVGQGKVVLLTTRLDPQEDAATRWNDYWSTTNTSWPVVFPNLLMRYLLGNPADARFNFPTGANLEVPLPPEIAAVEKKVILEGPGITGRDAEQPLAEKQAQFLANSSLLSRAGVFRLRTDDQRWESRWALQIPADESSLAKVPEEAVTELLGPGSVIPLEQKLKLRDVLETQANQPIDLFPWLLLLLLLAFVFEGFLANRFYRLRGNAQ